MEKLRRLVSQIANTREIIDWIGFNGLPVNSVVQSNSHPHFSLPSPENPLTNPWTQSSQVFPANAPSSQRLSTLSTLQLSLIPHLSFASSVYNLALLIRHRLYHLGIFHKLGLPMPVISVGNLTWGGNGKTPMVEFIARSLLDSAISPLILTRHMRLWRDLEIFMVNGMMPWGNRQLLPLGPLREPLTALGRADVVVIHHVDLVAEQNIEAIESTVQKVNDSLQYSSQKWLLYTSLKLSFVHTILKMGPKHVDRLDFTDHHLFQTKDIALIRMRLKELESEFAVQPIVVVTEKDYDRAPDVQKHFDPYQVLVLCSRLEIIYLMNGARRIVSISS